MIQALPGRSRRCPQDMAPAPWPSGQEVGTEEPEESVGGRRTWFHWVLFLNVHTCFKWEEMTFPQWSLPAWDVGERGAAGLAVGGHSLSCWGVRLPVVARHCLRIYKSI